MKLDLIKYTYTPLYQLDYYSPILYTSKLNKMIIGNSYNQRGGFDIINKRNTCTHMNGGEYEICI